IYSSIHSYPGTRLYISTHKNKTAMKKLYVLLTALLCVAALITHAQQGVAINVNGSQPDSKAILDISSNNKGLLTPRMTAVQRIAIAPTIAQKGLLVFDTDSAAFIFWNGNQWKKMDGNSTGGGSGDWTRIGNDIYNNNNGNVGIGTTAPKAAFNVAENKTVLFGRDTMGGGGKMMWIPSKYAFRVGAIGKVTGYGSSPLDSTIWDADSIGLFSFAVGHQNVASITGAFSAGVFNRSSGIYSATLGYNNTSKGFGSLAAGAFNIAQDNNALALGGNNTASGSATAIGTYNSAGLSAMALGYDNHVASSSAALGRSNNILSQYSFALGSGNGGYGEYATLIGIGNTCTGHGSTAVGRANLANSYLSTVIGALSDSISGVSNSFWVNTDPLFTIGGGRNTSSRKNVMMILKNGNTGFGTNAPAGFMHLKSNSAVGFPHLMLEETSDDYSRITFRNSNLGSRWELAAYTQPLFGPNSNARMNFYWAPVGDVLSLHGNGNAVVAGTLYQNSDQSLKKNIIPLKNTLNKLSQLNAYTYQWKDTSRGNEEQLGLLAQEVEKQFPQLVMTDENGKKSVAYANMVPVLLQAIKEQQLQIEAQGKKIETLQQLIQPIK
ncbi:MAG: tail fiber domain-containing protein, partial [Ferruginibacter sp.]